MIDVNILYVGKNDKYFIVMIVNNKRQITLTIKETKSLIKKLQKRLEVLES